MRALTACALGALLLVAALVTAAALRAAGAQPAPPERHRPLQPQQPKQQPEHRATPVLSDADGVQRREGEWWQHVARVDRAALESTYGANNALVALIHLVVDVDGARAPRLRLELARFRDMVRCARSPAPQTRLTHRLPPWQLYQPHTVRWFAQLAGGGFFDGCHLVRNAPHVLQFNCGGVRAERPQLQFQEYNAAVPHTAFTFGVAGRPGGPDFYVSLINNTIAHGPYGQDSSSPAADPCFGKLISGHRVLDHLHGSLPEGFLSPFDYVKIEKIQLQVIEEYRL